MATQTAKNATNDTFTFELPLAPGRAAAAASRPVALSNEDKASLDAVASQATLAAIQAKIIAAPSTEAKQDALINAINALVFGDATEATLQSIDGKLTTVIGYIDQLEALSTAANSKLDTLNGYASDETTPVPTWGSPLLYEVIEASDTDEMLGTGSVGDILNSLLVVPLTLSPGAVSIEDGSTNTVVFAGGADSVSTLHPFLIPMNDIQSVSGGWEITTGANVRVLAYYRLAPT